MIGLLSLLHTLLTAPFKSRRRLGRSGASVWTTSSSWVRCICAGSFGPMLTIIMTSEHIGRWVRMRRFLARFCGPGSLIHMQSLADFIIITSVSRFSVHTMGGNKSETICQEGGEFCLRHLAGRHREFAMDDLTFAGNMTIDTNVIGRIREDRRGRFLLE